MINLNDAFEFDRLSLSALHKCTLLNTMNCFKTFFDRLPIVPIRQNHE